MYAHPLYVDVPMGSQQVVLATASKFAPVDFPDEVTCEHHLSR